MTKSELIESLANKLKLPKGKAELIVNCVFDSMEAALKRGERIEIRGFGSFEIRHYKAYEGRNPRTGAKVDVRPKRLPFFKVGKELKERVNAGRGPIEDDDDDDDEDEDLEEMTEAASSTAPPHSTDGA
ncbi:MAG: integration host factor subunit beta [Deltaproteobacteria bacterium]|nr:integration host factor subunit beta [Deltaproteobacteria bacterium]